MTAIKPMLAKDAPSDLSLLSYPQIIQPKFDGIRALVVEGRVQSRSGKLIPNAEIQAALGRPEFNGLDGELLVGEPTAQDAMQRTSEFVMAPRKTGAAWIYYVFDKWDTPAAYSVRSADVNAFVSRYMWTDVPITSVHEAVCLSADEVANMETHYVNQGYEGAILRDPRAAYKHGRSGKLGPLLKVKRFADSEAVVVGVYERMHNANEAKRNAFGRTERSTEKGGMVPAGDLGGLICRTPEGVEFRIGTGYSAGQRKALWAAAIEPPHAQARDGLNGLIAKYKHFEVGVKDAPRFPVFLGFRDPKDMS